VSKLTRSPASKNSQGLDERRTHVCESQSRKDGGIQNRNADFGRRRPQSWLGAEILDVDIDAGVDVVEEIPAVMVGVLVDDKVIGTIPAPIGADGPVPRGDFKAEAAREPETVSSEVEAFDAVTIVGTEVLEMTVFERMVEVVALVVGSIMTIPVVIVDMGSAVDVDGIVTLGLGLGAGIVPLWGRRREMSLIGARRIGAALPLALGENRDGQEQ
jgi:hypothetical protein